MKGACFDQDSAPLHRSFNRQLCPVTAAEIAVSITWLLHSVCEYRKAETLALKRQQDQQATLATVLRSLVEQDENSKADEMLSRYVQQDERHQGLLIVYAQALLEKK